MGKLLKEAFMASSTSYVRIRIKGSSHVLSDKDGPKVLWSSQKLTDKPHVPQCIHNQQLTNHWLSTGTNLQNAQHGTHRLRHDRMERRRNPDPDDRISEHHGRDDEQEPRPRGQVIEMSLHGIPSTCNDVSEVKIFRPLHFFRMKNNEKWRRPPHTATPAYRSR